MFGDKVKVEKKNIKTPCTYSICFVLHFVFLTFIISI